MAAGPAAAASGSTFVLEQDGTEIPISPLSYNGQSIEEFYGYQDEGILASSTSTNLERSDTSLLFFYKGPNGLSLVVIHDKARDGSGGAVTLSFDGLPTNEGQWVVTDDGGDFDNLTQSTVDWNWFYRPNDGAAWRGGLDDGFEISITPAFNEEANLDPITSGRITDWQVLSGDANDPERHSLDMSKPVKIRPADSEGEPSTGFSTARDQKLGLAARIDSISAGKTDDRARVEPTLSKLSDAIGSGDLSAATAAEAVQRMKLGESVTESLFVGAFDVDSRLKSEFSVPSRATVYGGGPVQFVTRTSNVVVSSITDLFLMVAFQSKLWGKVPGVGKLLDDAASFLKEGIESVVEYIGRASDLISSDDYFLRRLLRNSQDIAEVGIDILFEGGKTAAKEYGTVKQERGGPLESLTADYVMNRGLNDEISRDGRDVATVSESLNDLDGALSADSDLEFNATLSEAADAANLRRGNIADTYYSADHLLTEKLEVLNAIDVVGQIIEIAGLLGSWFLGVGQILAAAGALMQAAGSIIDAVVAALDGITTVQDARYQHFLAIDRIVE